METVVVKRRWKPKIPDSLPKSLNEQEVARLKRVVESMFKRDRSIILFLLSSGCRKSKAINLHIKGVDLEKRTAIVRGKEINYEISISNPFLKRFLSSSDHS